MNNSTDLAMMMRDRAGWTCTDHFGTREEMIDRYRALQREVAELREAAQAIVTGYFDGDFRPSDRERLICVLRDLLRKCRPMVARSMMSSYRDAAPDEKPDAVLRAIDKALSGNTPGIGDGQT